MNHKNKLKHIKRKHGKIIENMSPYYNHLDLRCIDDMDDDLFAYYMTNVRGVNMLDLNETDITKESIRLLTRLEYVKELVLKDCQYLDNDCVEYLNELPELVFLHVKHTEVTIDGLLQLTRLTKLKELMFSAENIESFEEKMIQLKDLFPDCRFVVNSKPYDFS